MDSTVIITKQRSTPKRGGLSIFYDMNGIFDTLYGTCLCGELSRYYIVLLLVTVITTCFLSPQYIVFCGTVTALSRLSCYDVHRVSLSILLT